MKNLVALAGVTLALAAPASAQAPTLDDRVLSLEAQVAELWETVGELQSGPSQGDPCIRKAFAVTMNGRRTLKVASRDSQRKVYVAVISRSCLKGVRDTYAWSGYRGRP